MPFSGFAKKSSTIRTLANKKTLSRRWLIISGVAWMGSVPNKLSIYLIWITERVVRIRLFEQHRFVPRLPGRMLSHRSFASIT